MTAISPHEIRRVGCALQINLHPLDAPHAVYTLPHQLRIWGSQVDEVVLSLDLRKNTSSRYHTDSYEQKRVRLCGLLEEITDAFAHARVVPVDDGSESRVEVSEAFLGGAAVPLVAADGSPFHAYLHGMTSVRSRYVVHIDSDMLFGGCSQSWVREAIAALGDESIAICSPFPGPPRSDGAIRGSGVRVAADAFAYDFRSASTRILMLDKSRFASRELVVPLVRPSMKRRIDSVINNTPGVATLEECFSRMLTESGLVRRDFLGGGSGLWSIHPLHRNPNFYENLPLLIDRVERGDVPDLQRGDYDMNESMVDWSDVTSAFTLRKRLLRRAGWAGAGLIARLRGHNRLR